MTKLHQECLDYSSFAIDGINLLNIQMLKLMKHQPKINNLVPSLVM